MPPRAAFVAANGVARGNDMRAYLRLADALWSLRVVTSARTPGYPMFLVACRAVAAALGTDLGWVVAILQTLLLSGNAARAPTLDRVGSRHHT